MGGGIATLPINPVLVSVFPWCTVGEKWVLKVPCD